MRSHDNFPLRSWALSMNMRVQNFSERRELSLVELSSESSLSMLLTE